MLRLKHKNKKNTTLLFLLVILQLNILIAKEYDSASLQDSVFVGSLLEKALAASSQDLNQSIYFSRKAIKIASDKGLLSQKAEGDLIICSLYNSGMNYDSIYSHCEKAIDYFKRNGNERKLAWTYNNTGIIYDILGEKDKALETFQNGLDLFEKLEDKEGMGYCLNDLGVTYSLSGDYVEATEYFFKGLKLFDEINDELGLARAYSCIGFFYKRQSQNKKAKEYLFKAFEISEKINNKYWSAQSLSGYVKMLRGENKYTEALKYNQHVLALADTLNSDYMLLDANRNHAFIHTDLKEFETAEYYAFKTLALMEAQNRMQSQASLLNLLGEIYISKNELAKAKPYLEQVLKNEKTPKSKRIINYKLWVDYYRQSNDFKKALTFQTKYLTLRDSVSRKEKMTTIANIEKGYELGKKQTEIDLLNQQNEIQMEMVKNRNASLLIIIILGIILFTVLYRNTQYKKRLNRILENKITNRTKDLIAVNTRLEKSNEELKRFAHITSHDLREPLRNISGFLQLIERKKGSLNEETTTEYIALAKNNAIQMHELIEDVLDFSQLDESTKGAQKVDLNNIVDQVLHLLENEIDKKKVLFEFKGLPTLNVLNSDMLRLFQNLIENGIKYNESTPPKIEIECIENIKEYCIFIKDNGIGIEKEYFGKIFEMFSRLHARNVYQGSGIGLASCKKIIEKYHGEIHVQSKFGKGTTFILTFPK